MALYENFIYSNFPESIDTYEYMQDLTTDTYELVQQYQTLINQKKFDEASQYLVENPELNRSMFNAIKYNKIIDSIKSVETLYSEDVRQYILELMSFKGEYSNLQKYIRYNVVQFNSMIYLCISDCPLGTLPTDTTYWYPLSIKGEKGIGIGLSFDGVWNATITYNSDSSVSYGTCLYASTCDDNLAHTPSKSSSYWDLIIDFIDITEYDNSSSGLQSTNLQSAIDELLTMIITNESNINTNTNNISANANNISTINNSISDINSRINNVDNTRDADKSVNYSTSSGTANYANSAGSANSATNANYASSAGNSDSVDGFHFTISTTDLEAGSSALTTNMFYFVYE